jgi:hypothetical protein
MVSAPRPSSVIAWYATSAYPLGMRAEPVFEVVGSMVYPAMGHPSGRSPAPWYQLREQFAYPVDGHPGGASGDPSFVVREALVFPMPRWQQEGEPWFRSHRLL